VLTLMQIYPVLLSFGMSFTSRPGFSTVLIGAPEGPAIKAFRSLYELLPFMGN